MIGYENLNHIKEAKGLKIIHVNVQSLLPKFEIFENDFLDDKFDVVCVTETWLKLAIPNTLIWRHHYNLI